LPKLLTHWVFAEDLRRGMPADWRVRKAVDRNPNLYRLGAILPDTPFYLLWGAGARDLYRQAERFHERGAGIERFLATVGPAAGSAATEQRLALAAGIFCHATADAVFHPMVYYFSGFGTSAARCRHHRLEVCIDLHFTRNFKRPEIQRLDEILRGVEVDNDLLVEWIAQIFDLDYCRHRGHLLRALRRNVLFLKCFVNRPARLLAGKVALAAPAALKAYLVHFYPYRLPPPGQLFPEPVVFRNPATGRWIKRRIDEMGKESVDAALAVTGAVESGEVRLSALLPEGWNLHTGVGSRPKSAMTFFDTGPAVDEIAGFTYGGG
jgi:hypothetical protein